MKKRSSGKREQGTNALQRFSASLLAVVLVLTIPTLVAFGYFTASITNRGNHIQAGTYDLKVVVTKDGAEVSPATDGTYSLATGAYTVTLTPTGTVQTGYCEVKVDDTTTYYTEQIEQQCSFSITNYQEEAISVTFTPMWGTYEGTGIIGNAGIVVGRAQQNEAPAEEEPSTAPSPEPTAEPTVQPTAEPTAEPTVEPTTQPSQEPEGIPEPEAEQGDTPGIEPVTQPTTQPDLDGQTETE